ncbi:hypothetical protein HAALTHF_42620n [Vreelandella aquamarina]|nr:hypothetical protein HAALTHF_42620n [Halomonas axialensis]
MPGSTPATLNPTVAKVTQRIRERSAERRALYERRMADTSVACIVPSSPAATWPTALLPVAPRRKTP